jgi:hypothetical protein
MEQLFDWVYCAGPGDDPDESEIVSPGGVTRSVVEGAHERCDEPIVTKNSKVTIRLKIGNEPWQEGVEFTMQDGSQPSGVEAAALGLKIGDKCAFVSQGEATLNDMEPCGDDIESATCAGQIEILRCETARKGKFDMSPQERAEFANEMNDLGKRLYGFGRLDRAEHKWLAAADILHVVEPEDEEVNPGGAERNLIIFKAARSVYLNLALLNYDKGNYAESELYCGDVLHTNLSPQDFKVKAKALFRRACARLKMNKVSPVGAQYPKEATAEADLYRAHKLDPAIKPAVEKKMAEVQEVRIKHAARDEAEVDNLPEHLYDESVKLDEPSPFEHYGVDIVQALQLIRRENEDHVLEFCSDREREAKLKERARVYERIVEGEDYKPKTTVF